MGQGLYFEDGKLQQNRGRSGQWTWDFQAHLQFSVDLRANATADGTVSTPQAKVQNPELVTHELLSLASEVLKF